ncbi:hypothetical protein MIND_00003400 [Mycena indigotica]|uniref:Uncharacterized protein n=1 Tax=Mycena indigotica TaxID=2126181 RepID=A0A8H6WFM2_9AGAR|nr:uncharacterized protein MIND_00003400 [Mycena indigotica]KAF7314896.1 hypothetical protein MIND_00003400 [Mycena indigotica]
MDGIVKLFNFIRQGGSVDIELQLGDEVDRTDDTVKLFEFLRQGGTVDIQLQLQGCHNDAVDRVAVNGATVDRAAVDRKAVKKKMKKIVRRFYARVPRTDERRKELKRQGLLNVNKVIDAAIMHCHKEACPVTLQNIILSFSKRVADVERPIHTTASTETLDGPADDDYKYQFESSTPEEQSDDEGSDNESEDTETLAPMTRAKASVGEKGRA